MAVAKRTEKKRAGAKPFEFGGVVIEPGKSQIVDLPVSVLSNHTPMTLPVRILHGRNPGPTIFVSGAVHGDEVLGVEIIRRLLNSSALKRLRGTLLAIPLVNGFGFISHSRYLPDRRDLNRSFPGSPEGSLASQLAHLFLTQVARRCDLGIDLHTAALHRTNLPQIRVSQPSDKLRFLAERFGAPIVIETALRPGTLRAAAAEHGLEILLYEAGQAMRFDEVAIRIGVRGILQTMRHLDMLPGRTKPEPKRKPLSSRSTVWLRAQAGGIFRGFKSTGDTVSEGDLIGVVSDPFGENETDIRAETSGLIIGRTNLPAVNQGDALFHIARVTQLSQAETRIGAIEEAVAADPMFDEDEII